MKDNSGENKSKKKKVEKDKKLKNLQEESKTMKGKRYDIVLRNMKKK